MTDINTQPPPRFQQTASTGLLIAYLTPIARASDHRTITYNALSEAGRCDAQRAGRNHLNQAIKRIQKDEKRLFITVPGIGIKLATDAEIAEHGPAAVRHISRTARRTRHKTMLTNLDNLTNPQRLTHMATDAILGLQEAAARGIVQKRIEATIEKSGPKQFLADELLKHGGIKHID